MAPATRSGRSTPQTGKPIESFGTKASPTCTRAACRRQSRGGGSDSRRSRWSRTTRRCERAAAQRPGGPGGPGGEGGFGGSGFSISSPPAIYKNLAILGGSEGEGAVVGPPGDPQAFDVKTGKLVWRFHSVPQPGEKNAGTWGEGWKNRGGPAIWGLMTVDTDRGMVFLPTGNPGGSFYGGDRPGDNLYAVSVVALDAATGEYKWHFQTTQHDVFDADLAAAPALIDVVRDGKRIPAVAQITKMGGMLFILDRLTGKPLFGVEDRKVPQSHVPGELTCADATVPVKPAPWARLGMTKAELTTVTPESNRFCTEWWEKEQMYNDGPYTAYGSKGVTVVFSGTIGGGNWGGVAFNPELGYIFVNTSNLATIGRMVPDPQKPGQWRNELAYTRFWDDNKYPCQQPPWGELVAVNANTGDIAWKITLGVYPELIAKGIPPTGTPNLGGPSRRRAASCSLAPRRMRDSARSTRRPARSSGTRKLEAAGGCDADDVHGQERQAVRRRRRGRARRHRSRRHEQYPQKLVAFALPSRADSATPAGPTAAAPAPMSSNVVRSRAPVSAELIARGKALTESACTLLPRPLHRYSRGP